MGYLKKHSKKQRQMKPKVGSKKTKRRYNKSKAKRGNNKSTIKRKNNKLSLKRRKYYKQRGGGIIMEKLRNLQDESGRLITRLNDLEHDERVKCERLTQIIEIQNKLVGYRYNSMRERGDDEKIKKRFPGIGEKISQLERELNVIELEINRGAEAEAAEEEEESIASYHTPEEEEESTASYHPPEEEEEEESTASYHAPEEEEEIYNPKRRRIN
jgi:hypothetical protein